LTGTRNASREDDVWRSAIVDAKRSAALVSLSAARPPIPPIVSLDQTPLVANSRSRRGSFDFGWIEAIEQTGRHGWYESFVSSAEEAIQYRL